MPDIWLFLVAAATVTLAPGPDNIYVLTRGVTQGKKAGLVATLGFGSGLIFHTLLAVLGFAAMIKASPIAYDAIRYAGAAYLIYLGVRTLRAGAIINVDAPAALVAPVRIYVQSLIANILNPKVTLFFIAFLPQFVNLQAGHVAAQMLLLAALFILVTLCIFGSIAVCSGVVGEYLQRNAYASLYLNRLAGCAFIGLGVRIALPVSR